MLGAFLGLAPWLAVRRLVNLGAAEGLASPLVASILLTAAGLWLRRVLTPAFVRPFACWNCPPRALRILLSIAVGVSVWTAVLAVSQWGEQRWLSLGGIVLFLFSEGVIWRFPQWLEISSWRAAAEPLQTMASVENTSVRVVPSQTATDDSEEVSEDEPELVLTAGVQQQITRSQTDAGETALVLQRLLWRVGERTQVVHVAFCPPLGAAPKLHMETAEGEEVELRATLAESFGLRIEAKRSGGSFPAAESLLAFHALAEDAGKRSE